MSDFLTTRELAALLRVKERKVYDLAAENSLPVRRVTGKLLFPRKEIEAWIAASAGERLQPARGMTVSRAPLVMAGGHDILLEWALKESRSGIAALLDGALDGLARFRANHCIAAGLHIPERGLERWNVGTVEDAVGNEAVVLIEWAKRTRGLIYRPSVGRPIRGLADVGDLRFQPRQPEAGSELILNTLLAEAGMKKADLNPVDAVERSETDLAMAVAAGRADIGLGIEAAAHQLQLGFTPLVIERFDLLVWRKSYFDPPFQKLMHFCSTEAFRRRVADLGGYDCATQGAVQLNGP